MVPPVFGQTATPTSGPTPGVGPEELVDLLPVVVRAAWFLLGASVVALVGWFLVVPLVSRAIRRRNRNNPTIVEAVTRYLRAFVALLALVIGAGMAGYGDVLSDSAIVVAAVTLAVGVAGQAVIGSLISGLVLVSDPEFSVGNFIRWEGGEGTVTSITLRVTRVRTPDGELVTIPNTVLTSQAIVRPFGRERYRLVEHVGIDYGDDASEAMSLLTDAAGDVDGVVADPEPVAFVDELGDGEVIVRVHFWLDRPRPRDVFAARSEFAQAVTTRLSEADITLSPPSEHDLTGRITVENDG